MASHLFIWPSFLQKAVAIFVSPYPSILNFSGKRPVTCFHYAYILRSHYQICATYIKRTSYCSSTSHVHAGNIVVSFLSLQIKSWLSYLLFSNSYHTMSYWVLLQRWSPVFPSNAILVAHFWHMLSIGPRIRSIVKSKCLETLGAMWTLYCPTSWFCELSRQDVISNNVSFHILLSYSFVSIEQCGS